MLDLDGDGDERTGWNVFYLHVGSDGRVPLGAVLKQGDRIGHPSCEGGEATGTHVHIARKYNGEWMPAEGIGSGILAFNLEGWTAHTGSEPLPGHADPQRPGRHRLHLLQRQQLDPERSPAAVRSQPDQQNPVRRMPSISSLIIQISYLNIIKYIS